MKQNMAHSYQIMDRIGFIKKMISTHEKKLITEPRRSSSYLETSQTEVMRRTRESFHKMNETSTSEYYTNTETTTLRLLREELKITKGLLDKRSIELTSKTQENVGLHSDLMKLKEENDDLKYQLKKIQREKDDLKDELTFKLKKIDALNEEVQRLEKHQSQMVLDLKDAREAMQNIRLYENEIKQKEKQLLIDWQKLEKDKIILKEKHSTLLIMEEQLSHEVENIQILKNRINMQEKKLTDVQQAKSNQLKEKEQQLQVKEKLINFKELKVDKQEELKQEVDQKLLFLDLNEDLWKKRVQAEFSKIREVQQKLKIIQ